MESVSGFFSLGVTVVSAEFEGKVNAMTAAWAAPVSFNPSLVAVNIAPRRATHNMIVDSRKFVLNLLSEDQEKLAEYMGSVSGRDTDKFKEGGIKYKKGKVTGAPVVAGCLASLECKLFDSVKAGDHTIFVGEVVNVVKSDSEKKPLLYHKSGFHGIDGGL